MAELRVFSYSYKASEPQPDDISKAVAVLLEREVGFQKKRDNIKRQLLQQSDFTKRKVFHALA